MQSSTLKDMCTPELIATIKAAILLRQNDDPYLWLKIAPPCSDPLGPKTCLMESLTQPLPKNIFPKGLIKGWKDEDTQPIQETSQVPLEASSTEETSILSETTSPTDEARD